MIIKNTSEKTYLRILVKSYDNMNKHSYIIEQWEGEMLDRNFRFKRVQYSTNNRNEAKIMMSLFGLNKIKRYHLYRHFNGDLIDCLIEFDD